MWKKSSYRKKNADKENCVERGVQKKRQIHMWVNKYRVEGREIDRKVDSKLIVVETSTHRQASVERHRAYHLCPCLRMRWLNTPVTRARSLRTHAHAHYTTTLVSGLFCCAVCCLVGPVTEHVSCCCVGIVVRVGWLPVYSM